MFVFEVVVFPMYITYVNVYCVDAFIASVTIECASSQLYNWPPAAGVNTCILFICNQSFRIILQSKYEVWVIYLKANFTNVCESLSVLCDHNQNGLVSKTVVGMWVCVSDL